jgi:succinoglycan biosynthesis protein ExoM
VTRVTVAIASTGRLTLVRCLQSLGQLALAPGVIIDCVIADDSNSNAVPALVAEAGPLPFAVRVTVTGARNVSIARNACLDAATGDLVAFVDDDEWVDPDWLSRLLLAMDEFEADCVFGPVHPVYPAGTAAWIVRANPLHVDWGKRGRRVSVGRGGNTLFRRAVAVQHGLRFDTALGRTGGEDTKFFHDFGKTGAAMIVTDDAMVHEDAPPARVNVAYFRHRALRTGQIYARFVLSTMDRGGVARAAFYGGALLKAAVALGLGLIVYPFDKARWLRLAMRGWMNAGKLREGLGLAPGHMN